MSQINRRKFPNFLQMYMWRRAVGRGDPKRHWSVEVSMPFWTKERELGVWESKGKAGDLQVVRRSKRRDTDGK